jgi:hypothetical protein
MPMVRLERLFQIENSKIIFESFNIKKADIDVGYIDWVNFTVDNRRWSYLSHMLIHSIYRGAGCGRETIELFNKRLNLDSLNGILINAVNVNNYDFYRRHEWKEYVFGWEFFLSRKDTKKKEIDNVQKFVSGRWRSWWDTIKDEHIKII